MSGSADFSLSNSSSKFIEKLEENRKINLSVENGFDENTSLLPDKAGGGSIFDDESLKKPDKEKKILPVEFESDSKLVEKCRTLWGKVVEFFTDKNRDGEINDTKQGSTGDCWLLSAVNALNSTKAGKEILKETIEYTKGGINIHLKGAGSYFVSDEEILKTKGTMEYSGGDDDMIAIELAVNYALNKFKEDNTFPVTQSGEATTFEGWPVEDGKLIGETGEFGLYLLTGKKAEKIFEDDNINKILDEFAQDDSSYAITVGTGAPFKLRDVNNKKVTFSENHEYALVGVNKENDTVTLQNPWNTKKKITISRDDFNFKFSTVDAPVTVCNMSDVEKTNESCTIASEEKYPPNTEINFGGKKLLVGGLRYFTNENGEIDRAAHFNSGDKLNYYFMIPPDKRDEIQRVVAFNSFDDKTMYSFEFKDGEVVPENILVCDDKLNILDKKTTLEDAQKALGVDFENMVKDIDGVVKCFHEV